jgi:hypothetical protein
LSAVFAYGLFVFKHEQLLSNRNAGLRDDGKVGSRDMAAGDPAGLRDQVAVLFDEWARICDGPGSNDKAYAIYLSQLQHLGMLKGDDFSDRFFRILIVCDIVDALYKFLSSSHHLTDIVSPFSMDNLLGLTIFTA